MGAELAGKRILVLSDDDRLSRAIALNLRDPAEIRVLSLAPEGSGECGSVISEYDIDLLVVAASSPASEPLVLLARVALTSSVGQVPVLVISDRPFRPDPVARINHLGFPFCPEELHARVSGILSESRGHRLAVPGI